MAKCIMPFQLIGDVGDSGIFNKPCSTTLAEFIAHMEKNVTDTYKLKGQVIKVEFVDRFTNEVYASSAKLNVNERVSDILERYGEPEDGVFKMTVELAKSGGRNTKKNRRNRSNSRRNRSNSRRNRK